MTSLPLYWPLGADMAAIASGTAETPWQREVLERGFQLVPLDTLSPIAGLMESEAETDPLAGLERLAVIQPRGLSPADNVALDEWVRAGGHLLLALDPQLTGEYEFALGDPRRPTDMALVPPVLARWGLAGSFDPAQNREIGFVELPVGRVPVLVSGEASVEGDAGARNGCVANSSPVLARCDAVGLGTVTYFEDAAVFEHRELAGENGVAIRALLDHAFQ